MALGSLWLLRDRGAQGPGSREQEGTIDRYQYLLLMAACLVLTLPLEFVLRARVYRRPLRLLVALLPVVAVFSLWDVVGIRRHHWTYSARYTTGVHLGDLPLEELTFFVVIPICGLLTYEAVGWVLGRVRGARPAPSVGSDLAAPRCLSTEMPEYRDPEYRDA